MKIDSIEERSGNSLTVTLNLHRTATAFAFEIAEISARAGIHCRDQHEFARESQTSGCARDRHFSVFQWLAHHFERGAFEFRQLIEKKNAVVGKAYFARSGECAAAKKSNVADGVMRRTKRTRRNKRFFAVQKSGNAVDLCRLDGFIERNRRNDCRNSFRQHRLSGTRRPNHENIVTAGDRDLDCALHMRLSFHVGKIDIVVLVRREKSAEIAAGRQEWKFSTQKLKRLPQV